MFLKSIHASGKNIEKERSLSARLDLLICCGKFLAAVITKPILHLQLAAYVASSLLPTGMYPLPKSLDDSMELQVSMKLDKPKKSHAGSGYGLFSEN